MGWIESWLISVRGVGLDVDCRGYLDTYDKRECLFGVSNVFCKWVGNLFLETKRHDKVGLVEKS